MPTSLRLLHYLGLHIINVQKQSLFRELECLACLTTVRSLPFASQDTDGGGRENKCFITPPECLTMEVATEFAFPNEMRKSVKKMGRSKAFFFFLVCLSGE